MNKTAAIFTFAKPNLESTVATTRLARFFVEETGAPLFWDEQIAELRPAPDVLFIINGAYAFCNCLEAIGAAVARARRIVWIQQDYSIIPPSATSNAESPFRAAFRTRTGEPLHYWTTVRKNATATALSRYINWNALAYLPLPANYAALRQHAAKDLFYYGAYRAGRVRYFDRYFVSCPVPVTISSTSARFAPYNGHDNVHVQAGIARTTFAEVLASHGLGLYIEDKRSHSEFHSPASRFYEMLGAGLPMVFQPEAVEMLSQSGVDARPYVLHTAQDLQRYLRNREDIGREQRATWEADYIGTLRRTVRRQYKELLRCT